MARRLHRSRWIIASRGELRVGIGNSGVRAGRVTMVTTGVAAAPEGEGGEAGLFAALLALLGPQPTGPQPAGQEPAGSQPVGLQPSAEGEAVAPTFASPTPLLDVIDLPNAAAGTPEGKSLLKDLSDALIAINDALAAGKPIDPALEKKLSDSLDAVAVYLGTMTPPTPLVDPKISALASGDGIIPEIAPALPPVPAAAGAPVAPTPSPAAEPFAPVPDALNGATPETTPDLVIAPHEPTSAAVTVPSEIVPPAATSIAATFQKIVEAIAPSAPALRPKRQPLPRRKRQRRQMQRPRRWSSWRSSSKPSAKPSRRKRPNSLPSCRRWPTASKPARSRPSFLRSSPRSGGRSRDCPDHRGAVGPQADDPEGTGGSAAVHRPDTGSARCCRGSQTRDAPPEAATPAQSDDADTLDAPEPSDGAAKPVLAASVGRETRPADAEPKPATAAPQSTTAAPDTSATHDCSAPAARCRFRSPNYPRRLSDPGPAGEPAAGRIRGRTPVRGRQFPLPDPARSRQNSAASTLSSMSTSPAPSTPA